MRGVSQTLAGRVAERDLRNLEQVSDLETFRAFFALTCASAGQVLNLVSTVIQKSPTCGHRKIPHPWVNRRRAAVASTVSR